MNCPCKADPPGNASSAQMAAPESKPALPGQVCQLGPELLYLFIAKAVGRIVAVDFMFAAAPLERVFQSIDLFRSAPGIAVGEVALKRNMNVAWISEIGRRKSVIANRGSEF